MCVMVYGGFSPLSAVMIVFAFHMSNQQKDSRFQIFIDAEQESCP